MKRITMRMITVLLLISMVLPFCVVPAAAATVGTATLVTDASSLKVGDQIIIVAADSDLALSVTQNKNNRGQADITKSGDTVTFDENTQVITLEEGAVSGTFAFSVGNGYLHSVSTENNYLKTTGEVTENASFMITVSDGSTTVMAQGSGSRKQLGYNNSSKLFACYKATNPQKPIEVYLVQGVEDAPDDPDQPGQGGDLEDGDTNVLIKNVANLKVGDKIIIAALDYDYAISTTQKTNNRAAADIVKSDDTVRFGSDVQIIELEAGLVSGTFALKTDTGYLRASSSASNYLKTNAELDENGSWKITVDGATGAASIVAQGSFAINDMRYNPNSGGLFSCYSADSTMKPVCIYLIRNESSDDIGPGEQDTTGTGYDSADDVAYNTVEGVITNWGARDEVATFLSSMAASYYVGDYTYETMSQLSGGTSASSAPSSDLYEALQAMMVAEHHTCTKYSSSSSKDCRQFYQYTDCQKNDYAYVSTFYLGYKVSGAWASGTQYNQEHVWPKSKCIGSDDTDIGDIMHLRAANPNENSARGNSAYGESSGYYTPKAAVRGDCARIVLYMYVRWGNTGNMWGTSGVMESMEILLKWMEEDPVDTWEMGRNDSVESITGVRNVFVDYPEYAWLIFGEEIPENMSTPTKLGETKPDPVPVVESVATALNGASGKTFMVKGVVTLVDGKNLYVQDETGAICVRMSADVEGVNVGDTVIASGSRADYNGLPQLESGTYEMSSGGTLSAKDTTIGALTAADICTYVKLRGLTVTAMDDGGGNYAYPNVTLSDGTNEINLYKGVVPAELKVGDQIDILCAVSCYKETIQLRNTMASEITASVPECVEHNYESKVTYPTLTANGYTTFTCTVCGDSYVKNYTFPDVPSTLWSYNAIEFAVAKGFFTGYKSGNFGPTDQITRQDFVVVLARIAKVDLSQYTGRTGFPDVKAGDYYEKAVKWASSNGIVNGYNNGNFGVGDKITREQMVTILYNYAKKMGYDVSVPADAAAKLNAYADAHKITGYARPAVIWALYKGVISGMNATTIGPQEYASRGQTATILMNISKKGIMPI